MEKRWIQADCLKRGPASLQRLPVPFDSNKLEVRDSRLFCHRQQEATLTTGRIDNGGWLIKRQETSHFPRDVARSIENAGGPILGRNHFGCHENPGFRVGSPI